MSRETALVKGKRYLTEARLTIVAVDGETVVARCRGGAHVYSIHYERGRWSCSCKARTECAHLVAAKHVVVTDVDH